MQYAFFRVSTSTPSTATEDLNRFVKSHRVTHVEKHFHADGSEGYWSFCFQWQEKVQDKSSSKYVSKIDYKTVLSETQFATYSSLRECRKLLAEQEGVPVYAVATNEQLASIVRDNVESKAQLLRIAGFGSSKVERYGDAFLDLIRLTDKQIEELPDGSSSANPAD